MLAKKGFYLLIGIFLIGLTGCSNLHKRQKIQINISETENLEQKICPPLGKLIIGEKLYYKVRWLAMDVGHATLSIKKQTEINGQPATLVELKAWTNSFFSFFYRVSGTVKSYVNTETFQPIKYDSQTLLKHKNVFKRMEYDFKKLKCYAEDKKGCYEVDITEDILDPLGIFYYFRKNQIAFNEPVELLISGGKKNFPVTIFIRKQNYIKTAAGRFWAFMILPTKQSERQFDDALNTQGSMRIWFSADARRIPLVIRLKVPFGLAQATLTKIDTPKEKE